MALSPSEKIFLTKLKDAGYTTDQLTEALKKQRAKKSESFAGRLNLATQNVSPDIATKGEAITQAAQDLNAAATLTPDQQKRQDAQNIISPEITGNKIADTAINAVGGPLAPIVADAGKIAYEGLKTAAGGVKELVTGKVEAEPGETFGETVSKGTTKAVGATADIIGGGLQTVFSPITAVIERTPVAKQLMGKLSEGVDSASSFLADKIGTTDEEKDVLRKSFNNLFALGTVKYAPEIEKGVSTVAKTTLSGLKTATKPISYLGKEGFMKMTGLTEDTIKSIVENPSKFKTVKDLGVDTSKQNLFETVKTAIDDTQQALGDTGTGYETIRSNTTPAPVPSNYWENLASDLKIKPKLDSNGELLGFTADASSSIRSASDLTALTDTLSKFWGKKEMTPLEFMNYRADLADLAKYDATKTSTLNAKAQDLRANANEAIGSQIEGLRALDAEYAPQLQYVQKIKELIYDKKGNIKDNALQTIANLTGKGKEMKIARLEEILPDIAADIKAIKALENVQISAQNPVGQYGRGGATAVAFVQAMSGNISALPVAIGLALTHPSIVSEFLRAFGEAKLKLAKADVDAIAGKIGSGELLSTSEASAVGSLLTQLTAQDLVPFLGTVSTEPVEQTAQ